jgi:elongation factor 1-gamma
MADSELYPAVCAWVYPTFGLMPNNKNAINKGKSDVATALKMLDDALASKTFLVGEKVSLADITVATTLLPVFTRVLDVEQRKGYGNVSRWFVTCVNQPAFKGVLGDVSLCEKELGFDAQKYNEYFPKQQKAKKEKAPKAAKKDKPKEENKKPKEEKKPKEDKPKDPCAALPKGTFDMNAFKGFYSNNAEDDSIKYFWDKFDSENYSIWSAKYNESLEKYLPFMCNNLVGGMMQRVEKMSKYAFGSVCVFGEKPNCEIHGIWIWRGQDLIFELNEDWNVDAPSYKFTKLDPSAEDTKVMVSEFFKWEGAFAHCGGAFKDGKIFK